MNCIAEQIASEEAEQDAADVQALRDMQENLRIGNIDKLPKAKLLIGNMFPAVHSHIIQEQERTGRGPGAHLRGWLRAVPADVAAVIAMRGTMRQVLNAGFRTLDTDFGATVQRIAVGIAREWIQEAKIRQAAEVNPAYYDAAMKGLDRANVSSRKHISMTVNRIISNALAGLYENDLSETDLIHLGKHGLQACLNAGLVEINRSVGAKGKIVTYALPEAVKNFLGNEMDALKLARPNHPPMLAEPMPWRALVGGGFHTERNQLKSPLVDWRKRLRKGKAKAFHAAASIEQMPQVYQYVNYVQSIPFEVHTGVFQHILRVWHNGGGALGLPKVAMPAKPEFPFAEDWSKATAPPEELETFQRWKHAVTRWYELCMKHRSTLWEVSSFIKHTRERPGRAVYFPVFLDSRGRLYYRCSPNPQGSDMAKAAIQFHRKKALGKRGIFWLKVHIANCFGHDAEDFKVRAAWTDSVWDRLQGSLERPEDSGVYEEADSPMCALAGVMELAAAYASGNPERYETGLPVHMDATCSGLQHFSAMLRDEVGGQYVNLTPGGLRKADIYQRVADLATATVTHKAAGGDEMAQEWVRLGIARKLAKGPTMTYVYGATLMSIKDGVVDWLIEEGWTKEGLTYNKMAIFMAKVLLQAVEKTVPAAAAVMRWLKARLNDVDQQAPVEWCTPLGFPVIHDYRDEERLRVRLRSCDVEYVVMYRKLDSMKVASSKNAISPNFVHSLDGTHLGMTALRMQAGGRDMVCIHDSFGTHPCDVDDMHSDIREAFIKLYERDILSDWANQLGLNVTYSSTGQLDLNAIRDSQFFFC
ncbi:DNA-dependent RNA polymerase [compost metagenome]